MNIQAQPTEELQEAFAKAFSDIITEGYKENIPADVVAYRIIDTAVGLLEGVLEVLEAQIIQDKFEEGEVLHA